MSQSDQRSHRYGQWMVFLQFSLLFGLVAITSPITAIANGYLATILLMSISLMVALAALQANRLGNFNIHPSPKQNGCLIVHGIYRYIRHPMYTAVIFFGGGCVASMPTLQSCLLFFALCLVLLRKARLEETWLTSKYPVYTDYQAQTKGFFPGWY